MYILIGAFYVLVVLIIIMTPFFKRSRAQKLAFSVKGKSIKNRYEMMYACKKLLEHFHTIRRESVIVMFFDDKNKCIDVKVRFGSKNSMKFHTKDVCSKAPELKAQKVLVACNHSDDRTLPTHNDILHAATLYTNLPDEVELMGYVVWCKNQAKSVLESYDFKQMIRGVR